MVKIRSLINILLYILQKMGRGGETHCLHPLSLSPGPRCFRLKINHVQSYFPLIGEGIISFEFNHLIDFAIDPF